MDFFENIGYNILKILELNNIQQKELAEMIGVSKQVMTKIIKGQKSINVLEIKKIAQSLDVTIDELIKEREKIEEEPMLLFMADIKKVNVNKEDISFLSNVIQEIIILEDTLNV